MLWNILLLALSWSLGQGIFFIQISITTLAATSFINWYLATIPIGSMLLVATIWSVFLPRVIARYGYRPPFYFGALLGMIGAGLCIVAAWFKLYWLLVYLNEAILKNQSSEYKTVIQEQFLINILDRKQLTNIQFELAPNQNMRQLKEKVQRKVDNALLKMDENMELFSKPTQILSCLTYNSFVKQHKSLMENNQKLLIIDKNINNELLPNKRSLRHNYIQTKIPRNQLHLLVEQDDWNKDIYFEFKHELNIIDSNNSLDLIRHITYNISLLIKENDSISGKP
ncbi:unnamed protein product [Rotaria sp. Silwood1]|nr:unnamed protein product [Rotaria sp. Silwood1]